MAQQNLRCGAGRKRIKITYKTKKCKSFGSLLAASWKQFTLIIMNHETYESRNFQVDTSNNLVHIIIFVTKCSTKLHHWTEDSTILITVVLYVQPTETRNSYISNIITLFFIIHIHRSVHIHSRNHTWRIMTWETSRVFFSAWSYTFTTVTLPYQILSSYLDWNDHMFLFWTGYVLVMIVLPSIIS
jgi:hypothetical protein